jgi:hypothetical protein
MPHRLDYRAPDADADPPAEPPPPLTGRATASARLMFWLTWLALAVLLPPLFYVLLTRLRAAR